MRAPIRFILALLVFLGVLALLSVVIFERLTYSWFTKDLEMRSRLTASAVSNVVLSELGNSDLTQLISELTRVTRDERLYAVAICSVEGSLQAATAHFPASIQCPAGGEALEENSSISQADEHTYHVTHIPITEGKSVKAGLLFVHEMDFVKRRSRTSSRYIYLLFFLLAILVSIATLVILRLTWKGWMSEVRSVIREKGKVPQTSVGGNTNEWLPIVRELRTVIGELESERKLNEGARVVWDPNTLKDFLSNRLSEDQIIVVANREPYIHNRNGDKIEVQVPASGLVTALEPVMRACSGIWVAHGSGSADRDVVDAGDRVWVPPGEHSYQIRRIWLSAEEEDGYYYGFSNEGLWPLCHIAHTRPVFRSEDWEQYQSVNKKFARAVCEEANRDDPLVLVQDYHFALLPALIRESLPRATIITFWHIPWPNAEAFGICPWREEILKGLLGSTIMGFHTRYHRNNFVDTVDRFLECRIDREQFTVTHQEKITAVRNYPISIEWPSVHEKSAPSIEECRSKVFRRHKIKDGTKLLLGVDRLDYTKGIVERLLAVEKFLEQYPEWQGKVTLLQIAAPSRSKIDAYSRLESIVNAEAKRINARFAQNGTPPIILLVEHHEPASVFECFRAADVCLVTSLHDGMNLVAKEFIASRNDECGVLILSSFTGASRELPEALIVSPYNIDNSALAIRSALNMPEEEQRHRMRSMREQVKEFNVYRWAGRMLVAAANIREKNRVLENIGEGPLAEQFF